MYKRFGKRQLDTISAIVLVILLAPIFIILDLAVRWKLGKPVIFRQTRLGMNGHHFTIYKFRTMLDSVDNQGNPLPDSQRQTHFGRILRNYSLDELPELRNIIRGDMSLVGPRPLLMKYLVRYSADQMRRHEVRPGITGWAQVNGRNAISWEEKFELDVWYVDNYSFILDLKILFMTFRKILSREGINQPGYATVEEFLGTNTVKKGKQYPLELNND